MGRRGFTLLEILVTISLFSLIIFISMPVLSRFKNALLLKITVQKVSSDLRARQLAALVKKTTLNYQVSSAGQLPGGLKLISDKKIVFSGNGLPIPGGSGTQILGNNYGKQGKIIVSSQGRIRIE